MANIFTFDQVQQHRSRDSCWVILYGKVYDVTSFLPAHPGGSNIILQLAGTDATPEYDPIHPPGTLEDSLPASACLGTIDAATLPQDETAAGDDGAAATEEEAPRVEHCLNLDDIAAVAAQKVSRKAWGYYYSAGDDLISKRLNNTVYQQILLRPRIFIDCTRCDTTTTVLGHSLRVPFFVSPAAMARLGHPDGEQGIAKACAAFGALQVISNNASQRPEQIVAGAPPDQVFGWQLYVQDEREKSEAILRRIHQLPNIKFVCLTLDAPVSGKREHDERVSNMAAAAKVSVPHRPAHAEPTADAEGLAIQPDQSVGKALFAGTAADLTWKTTLPWLRQHTHLPIVLKGVQTHEDAYLASVHAPQVRGIMLSNHGGRALDTAPPAIHTLLEIRKYCPAVFDRVEVYVDGGIRRGTDVVKALALGAKAVGLGRAPLYGLGAYGQAGVERTFEILKAEVETAMRLLGVERVGDLGPQHVNTRAVERDIFDGPAGLESLDRDYAVKSKL
jgi:isopentenyl diphosphate isomerase/L-lactate dehydrogenase-like FMN-dependent dehydrogenase